MTPTMLHMRELLKHAYDHPDQRAVFYSANGAVTGSSRLNTMECWDWSVAPAASAASGGSTCLVPLALGCPPKRLDAEREWIEPLIADPAQVKDLQVPDVWSGRTGVVLREIEQLCQELPPETQVREPDIQSPLGIAELMWDESFYVALVEEPDAVHELLDKITDFQIAFVTEIHRVAGARLNAAGFPPIWADERGTMVSDDTMSLISPSMHREFSLPYVNRLADACGPLFYHSCSWRRAYFGNIHSIHNVRAYNWNPGNSDDPAAVIREFSGRAVLTPFLTLGMHRDKDLIAGGLRFYDEVDLLRYLLDAVQPNTCLMLWFSDVVQDGALIDRIYDLLQERGLTPSQKL
jgi:hypothetical protein